MGLEICEIQEIKKLYPSLSHVKDKNANDVFSGKMILNHTFNDVYMTGEFVIELLISKDYPFKIPTVKETSGQIDKNYPHIYTDGALCLASNFELKLYIKEKGSVSTFIEKFIIPYFFSYKYYEKYKVYPFGERSHGTIGDFEYLKELLNVDDTYKVINIMKDIIDHPYRGHRDCPCGSGKRIRNCHGVIMRRIAEAQLDMDFKPFLKNWRREREIPNGAYN